MEPVGWVIDTEGSQRDEDAEVHNGSRRGRPPLSTKNAQPGSTNTPQAEILNRRRTERDDRELDLTAAPAEHTPHVQDKSSHNSVNDLLRRIAREAGESRQRRSTGRDDDRSSSSASNHGYDRREGDYRRHSSKHEQRRWRRREEDVTHTTDTSSAGLSQQEFAHSALDKTHSGIEDNRSREASRHGVSSQDTGYDPAAFRAASSRRSTRTNSLNRRGDSRGGLETAGRGGWEDRVVPTAHAVTAGPVSELDQFTGAMWGSASCRQVLQAMFFGVGSAVPAGSSEEYKELEEFIPKYLIRREKAKASALATPPATDATDAATSASMPPKALPPAISALPGSFHKRYLMNFTVLSPEQQRASQEADQLKLKESDSRGGGGWRGRTARGRWGAARVPDYGKAALRELAQRGVLDREEVKAMLKPGPLQDFRGSVLQAFIDFRMRRSLAKVIKVKQDRASLPIAAFQSAITRAVAENPCVLVAGDTGCGKSTQVPQYLLQAGYGKVACTQPRRISAMGLCRRVSYETLNEHGSEVAYQVRFDSSRRRSSRILFLTEGLLLRQIASDPDLSMYSVIIVDEVHERHAGCDFLLGLLRAVLRRRSDLKVVLMSATINPELFSRFFDGAPLIRVPGRMHPVDVRYVPTAADNDIQEVVSRHDGEGQRKLRSRGGGEGKGKRVIFDARPYVKLLESIDSTTPRDERGDLLVFLSGMGDMLAVSEGVREYVEAKTPRRWVVLMLHSSLSVEEQDKVFDAAPLGTRKMILATNIAETSVTIDGVRFVADSGKAKEMSWDPTSGVRSLQEFWVSRASAEQRKGRAGRTGPGVCFRLYARGTFDRLAPFAEPEIRRCPLEGLVLQMKSLGLDDPRHFPYLSPPPPENLRAALEALALLGATDAAAAPHVLPASHEAPTPPARITALSQQPSGSPHSGEGSSPPSSLPTSAIAVFENATARAPLTPLGRLLSTLPVDPSVGKMLALGALFGESEHVLTLAAALTTQTPFDARAAASASGANPVAEFASPGGDPFTVMNAYDEWLRVKAGRKESSRRWCKRHGLQEQRLYEITKLRRQFEDLLGNAGLIWLGAAAQGARKNRAARSKAAATSTGRGGASKDKLRELKMRSQGRKRKVLEVDQGVSKGNEATEEGGSGGEDEAEQARRDLSAEVGEGAADFDASLDLSSLEFYMAQDVDQLAESSGRRLARRDVAILKAILCQGLYPQFAVADAGNAGRASNEQQYVTRPSGGLFMSPSSVLACQDFGVVGACGEGSGGGWRGSAARGADGGIAASRGAAADAGRSDGLLCYGQLMETQRPFVSSVTPLPALQALLLFSARVDTSEDASMILFDHWLLVEMRGRDPSLTGQKLLVLACGLRARLGALLYGALAEAESRKASGGDVMGGGVNAGGASSTRNSAQNEHEGLQDLPPLLLMAKRAWSDGGDLKRRRRGKGRGDGKEGGHAMLEREVDWAQEAENLSVDLADFMLQTIGYDVRSVSPRHVEAMLVDTLRLKDPAEVRRVLRGYPGLPDPPPLQSPRDDDHKEEVEMQHTEEEEEEEEEEEDIAEPRSKSAPGATNRDDRSNMPELLAALSRAIEEEIRGSKGLFGLETGVLERLKAGARVTPFLRHGSVRRQASAGAAPHGLAAGGMKKWWRCPRCHISQVVDLEAIHNHFKVCLADPAPRSKAATKDGSRSGGHISAAGGVSSEAPTKRRMVGTSVKSGRSHGRERK